MSEEVNPLGLVRLDATTPGGKPVALKLVAHGGDAKARVIKPVGPFDASKAMQGMQGLTVPATAVPLVVKKSTATVVLVAPVR